MLKGQQHVILSISRLSYASLSDPNTCLVYLGTQKWL